MSSTSSIRQRAAPFDGDLEDYAKWLAEADSAAAATPARKVESADARRQRKRAEAEQRNRLSPLRAAVARCESALERLATERARVQSELDLPEIYADSARERLAKLLAEQARLGREAQSMEARWLESSEQLEAHLRKLNSPLARRAASSPNEDALLRRTIHPIARLHAKGCVKCRLIDHRALDAKLRR